VGLSGPALFGLNDAKHVLLDIISNYCSSLNLLCKEKEIINGNI